jgi:hypothetical protein
MVNGFINSPQIPQQFYQAPQAQAQAQAQAAVSPQELPAVAPQPQATVPYQYMSPVYTPKAPAVSPVGSSAGTSAVNINIISPSVYGQQGQSSIPYAPIYNYPQAPQASANANASATATASIPPAPVPPAPTPAPEAKKTKEKNIVPLTDEYVKTLENYLNNSSEQVRLMGTKEIMARFKEDESRRQDAALTALLNKSLQDESNHVRVLGMTTIAAGYAGGDKNTAKVLENLKQSTSNYNEDALLASQALMKISEKPATVTVAAKESDKPAKAEK